MTAPLPKDFDTRHQPQGTQFISPAGKLTESRSALHALVKYLYGTNLPVFVDGARQTMELESLHQALAQDLDSAAENGLCESLHITIDADDFTATESSLDFLKLQSESETAFQNGHFQEEFFKKSIFCASDSAGATDGGPFFMEQQTARCRVSDGYFVTCMKTGKPDGTSTVAPMDIVIKSDAVVQSAFAVVCVEVLLQACKRAVVRRQLYAYLKYSIAFAVSNRTAWCVVVHATDDDVDETRIMLWQIPHSSVPQIWAAMTSGEKHSSGFSEK